MSKVLAHVNIRILVHDNGDTSIEIINHLGGPIETCKFNAQRDVVPNLKLQQGLGVLKGLDYETSERL